MKFIAFILLIFTSFSISAQSGNNIDCRAANPKANTENQYHYYPPEGLRMPDNPEAVILFPWTVSSPTIVVKGAKTQNNKKPQSLFLNTF